MATAPSRKTSDAQVNEFNAWMRSQPWYKEFFSKRGLNPNKVSLSRGEQGALESLLRFNGVPLPDGMHIDQAGNVNQKNTLGRNLITGAAIGGGALTGLGLAGIGPLSGLGGGAAASGAAGGAAAGGGIPTLGSTAIGTGMGVGPASLAGTSSIPSAMAATATAGSIPTLASRAIGSGMGTDPASIGSGSINSIPTIPSRQIGNGMGTDPSLGGAAGGLLGGVGSALKSMGGSDWLQTLLKYGLPAAGAFGAGRALGGGADLDIPPPPTGTVSMKDVLRENPHLQELVDLNSEYARRTNMQQNRADPLLGAAQQLAMNLLPRTAFGPLTPQRKLGS